MRLVVLGQRELGVQVGVHVISLVDNLDDLSVNSLLGILHGLGDDLLLLVGLEELVARLVLGRGLFVPSEELVVDIGNIDAGNIDRSAGSNDESLFDTAQRATVDLVGTSDEQKTGVQ